METDKPFEHHSKVVSHYPSDYFSHVKIKEPKGKDKAGHEKTEAPSTHSPGHSNKSDNPGDGPGNSLGKGKGKGKSK
jgi:hypothetical protein